jgi:hypothetical protein
MDDQAQLMAKALSNRKKPDLLPNPEPENIPTAMKDLSATETSQYIAAFSAELSHMARQAKLDLLAYLLDMARLEASRTTKDDR